EVASGRGHTLGPGYAHAGYVADGRTMLAVLLSVAVVVIAAETVCGRVESGEFKALQIRRWSRQHALLQVLSQGEVRFEFLHLGQKLLEQTRVFYTHRHLTGQRLQNLNMFRREAVGITTLYNQDTEQVFFG